MRRAAVCAGGSPAPPAHHPHPQAACPTPRCSLRALVASLYRQGSSHALHRARNKVGLFLDYLRTRFQETSPDFGDDDFRERLSQKAGLPRARVDELLRLVNFARTAPQVNDQRAAGR
ncbi:MAG: hypothetical protein WKG07_13970 [Hymenobacter sp.]